MIYIEFMKNFFLADTSELMAFTVISAFWAQKRLIPIFYTWCTFRSWKIFFSPIRASYWLLDSFWPPEPKNVWFLLSTHDIHRVHEKFFSRRYERADGFYSHFGLLTQKRLIPTFYTWCTFRSWKIFFSPIRASYWLLDSFWPPEPKNVWFLLSTHDIHRVHENFFSRRFERPDGFYSHFGLLSPKRFDSYFLHDARLVHEKFSSRRFERAIGC